MSWQSYVDTNLVGTGEVTSAAIVGHKGGVWASSAGFQPNQQEITALVSGFDDPSPLQAGGIHVNGVKYFALQANDRSIYGKQGGNGLIAVKTNQAVLIGHYASPILPGQATKVVESLADYLISVGY
ncbi:Profilin/allergen [Meira miltonrushii]|uniref:Profilin n=1 Tax=Meira miltonrushii TaxID=1280837 RepID=A0A316VJX6_9BASI|nr:Profilin/allergen [Meira miltonrushii]PWN37987.1 Profilin/allergen [Meira miltonrushii]